MIRSFQNRNSGTGGHEYTRICDREVESWARPNQEFSEWYVTSMRHKSILKPLRTWSGLLSSEQPCSQQQFISSNQHSGVAFNSQVGWSITSLNVYDNWSLNANGVVYFLLALILNDCIRNSSIEWEKFDPDSQSVALVPKLITPVSSI